LIVQRSSAAGTPSFRIFEIAGAGTSVDAARMTIRGGSVGFAGGGVLVNGGTTLKLTAVSIRDNVGSSGGGIANTGNLIVLDSTLSNNTSSGGGAFWNNAGGSANIANSTFSGNVSANNGGAILTSSALTLNNVTISENTGNVGAGIWNSISTPVNIRNTIVAANISGNGDPRINAAGIFSSGGSNLIGTNNGPTGFTNGVNGDIVGTNAAPINPQLGPLANNGGPTDTKSVLESSPALHRGTNCVVDASCGAANPPVPLALDQRGGVFSRRVGTNVDIGAYELSRNVPVITSINPSTWGVGGPSFEMTVNGISFTSTAAARVGDQLRAVTFVSSSEVRVQVLAADVQSFGTKAITVINPDIPSGSSAAVNLALVHCSISSQSVQISSAGGSASTVITTSPGGCPWSAVASAPWVHVLTPSAPGTGSLSMAIDANTGPARQGLVTVTTGSGSSVTFVVSQDTGCSYSVPASTTVQATGGTSVFSVATAAGCPWMASTTTPWIQITSGASGLGNGQVTFTFLTNTGAARSGTITVATRTLTVNQLSAQVQPPTFCDFDGDRKTDIGVRTSTGEWWTRRSSDGQVPAFQFGVGTDIMAPADFTGDGKTDIAFFRPSTGEWFVLRSENLSYFSFPFGTNGDIPAPADYDGDGKADPAVFRPSSGMWFVNRSSDQQTASVPFGTNGDVPVPADYDGDGRTDFAIFRPSVGQWWLLRSTAGTIAFGFGASADKPVQGDYTGDGKSDVAFWRPSTGEWFVLRSENLSYYSVPFGIAPDVPAPGDYDGDGKYDTTVFRPSSATWFIQRSSGGTTVAPFGNGTDRPIPNAFVP
jgi:predicted outer membrane repeat protein